MDLLLKYSLLPIAFSFQRFARVYGHGDMTTVIKGLILADWPSQIVGEDLGYVCGTMGFYLRGVNCFRSFSFFIQARIMPAKKERLRGHGLTGRGSAMTYDLMVSPLPMSRDEGKTHDVYVERCRDA
jgi:hypothetical protein